MTPRIKHGASSSGDVTNWMVGPMTWMRGNPSRSTTRAAIVVELALSPSLILLDYHMPGARFERIRMDEAVPRPWSVTGRESLSQRNPLQTFAQNRGVKVQEQACVQTRHLEIGKHLRLEDRRQV